MTAGVTGGESGQANGLDADGEEGGGSHTKSPTIPLLCKPLSGLGCRLQHALLCIKCPRLYMQVSVCVCLSRFCCESCAKSSSKVWQAFLLSFPWVYVKVHSVRHVFFGSSPPPPTHTHTHTPDTLATKAWKYIPSPKHDTLFCCCCCLRCVLCDILNRGWKMFSFHSFYHHLRAVKRQIFVFTLFYPWTIKFLVSYVLMGEKKKVEEVDI